MPFDRIRDQRVQIAKEDSDDNYFNSLMYMGEMLVKLSAIGLVAGVNEDRDRHRYRQTYQLVRANGIGEWSQVIDEVLTGVASQYLIPQARDEQTDLTKIQKEGTWQYDSVVLLDECLHIVDSNHEITSHKIAGRSWYSKFAQLRNSTRGHGALPSGIVSEICARLSKSIDIFVENFVLFKRPWAYLYQNLSGKYRVIKWTEGAAILDTLKTRMDVRVNISNGVHIFFGNTEKFDAGKHLDELRIVDLISSDVDAIDFFFANGGFNGRTYEMLSYITGNRKEVDCKPYLAPIINLPPSETQGLDNLDVRGESLVTLPPIQQGYIHRDKLEEVLYDELSQSNFHRIVTLVGRGGIGKTWLALNVLNRIATEEKFTAILWFSARDIDLLPDGAKQVKPHVLTENDIANEFARLVAPYVMTSDEFNSKSFNKLKFFSENLTKSSIGPILFVFDNFETVKSPIELFNWIDAYVRPPNKVLITTRFREFKGDNPVQVHGMTMQECDELIEVTSKMLGISNLLTSEYKNELVIEADGHPYVIKILLGEVAKAKRLVPIERIVATQEDLLDTLFERTYSRLTPVAKRVFLTLSNWRSVVPQIALEAVLLRSANDRMDVAKAVEELYESSLIEIVKADTDSESFITLPLVASSFGQRKIAVSPMKSDIQADTQILQFFGAAKHTDIQHGISPRIERLFRNVAKKVSRSKEQFDEYLPMLEFIARKNAYAWLLLAKLYEEENDWQKEQDTLLRFLEFSNNNAQKSQAWHRLAELYYIHKMPYEEIHARVELCQLPETDFGTISSTANRLNALFRDAYFLLDSDEKNIIARTLVEIMERRVSEADATDCSRLAWLCLHIRDDRKAREYAELGLNLDHQNYYCIKLLERLG